jgi:hypothetical protein
VPSRLSPRPGASPLLAELTPARRTTPSRRTRRSETSGRRHHIARRAKTFNCIRRWRMQARCTAPAYCAASDRGNKGYLGDRRFTPSRGVVAAGLSL